MITEKYRILQLQLIVKFEISLLLQLFVILTIQSVKRY
jgi:hypothetical protein